MNEHQRRDGKIYHVIILSPLLGTNSRLRMTGGSRWCLFGFLSELMVYYNLELEGTRFPPGGSGDLETFKG